MISEAAPFSFAGEGLDEIDHTQPIAATVELSKNRE